MHQPIDEPAPRVALVGAGPGDPELLTLAAVRRLAQADVVLVDDLVDARVLAHCRPGCRVVRVGKRGGCASTPQAFIERLLVSEARSGRRVVRLKGGDPSVFGRGGEEIAALDAAGIAFEVVPGVTTATAAAASLATSLTHRDHAKGVVLVTGHPRAEAPHDGVDWAALAASGLTLAVYMGAGRAAAIRDALLAGGRDARTPVAVVAGASTRHETRATGTLAGLEALAARVREQAGGAPMLMLVGEALAARGAQGVRSPVRRRASSG